MTQLQNANGRGVTLEERPADPNARLLDQVVQATRYSVRDVETMAAKAARSQMFGMDEAQAFTLMMIAESEGLHPIQALKRYHCIQGRPSMRADAMQAEFQRHGGRLRWVQTDDEVCELEAWHPVLHPEHLTFKVTRKGLFESGVAAVWDAKANGGKGDWKLKDMYVKFGRQMLRARTVSEMVRAIDPGIIVGIYTPEEVSDFDDNRPVPAARPNVKRLEVDDQPVLERPPGPAMVHEPNNEPKAETVSEAKAWVRSAIQMANDKLKNLLLIEGKGDKFEPIVKHVNQLVNAMISDWITAGLVIEESVQKPNGSRDPAKAGATFQMQWQAAPDEVKADVWDYLVSKAQAQVEALGLEWNFEDEPRLPEALAGTADDTFEEGRE